MKCQNLTLQYIRHRSVLHQTIKTEKWLQEKAHEGLVLVEVRGSKYAFMKTTPQEYNYFVMTPETGTNSDAWVFHEFKHQKGQTQIPCTGIPFLSPSNILLINCAITNVQSPLISYYYRYRNYRLLRRFRRNTICSALFLLIGVGVMIKETLSYMIALFPYALGFGLLLLHSLLSYLVFYKDCTLNGYIKPEKKPAHPGWDSKTEDDSSVPSNKTGDGSLVSSGEPDIPKD